jgi:hypothetical protein
MKITHRIDGLGSSRNMTGKLDARYAAEVERMTVSRERAFEKAERALGAAERKLSRIQRTKHKNGRIHAREIAVAWEIVELRRAELAGYARLMTSTPSGANHRGTKSFRPVPVMHTNHPNGSLAEADDSVHSQIGD